MADKVKLHMTDVTDREAIFTTVEVADLREHVGHVIRCEARPRGADVVCVTCGYTVLVFTEALDRDAEEGE